MRNKLMLFAAAGILAAGLSAGYAQDQKAPAQRQDQDMMNGGITGMMGQMSRMMENCNKMMESHMPRHQESQPEKKG
jgi:hypothetical protein